MWKIEASGDLEQRRPNPNSWKTKEKKKNIVFTSSSVGKTRWRPLSFSVGIDVPLWRASRISVDPDLNCFSIILIAKLRLLSKMFRTLKLDKFLETTAGEDFALGFWQKSSSIFLKFMVKSGRSVDDQTDLSKAKK